MVNTLSGATITNLKRDARTRAGLLSHSGSHLLVGGFDRCVSIVKVDEGARLFRFKDVLQDVFALAATDHGGDEILVVGGLRTPTASGGGKGVTVVFDAATGTAISRWERAKPVYALALTQEGAQCAVGAYDNQVIVHDVATGAPQQTYTYKSTVGPAFIWSVSFSGCGNRLAVGCWNHRAYVYENMQLNPSDDGEEVDNNDDDSSSSNDDEDSSEDEDDSERKGSARSIKRCPEESPYAEFKRKDRVYSANLTYDGERLLVGGRDKRVVMYQVFPVRKIWSHKAKDIVYSASLSADSSVCAVGGPMDHVSSTAVLDGNTVFRPVAAASCRGAPAVMPRVLNIPATGDGA